MHGSPDASSQMAHYCNRKKVVTVEWISSTTLWENKINIREQQIQPASICDFLRRAQYRLWRMVAGVHKTGSSHDQTTDKLKLRNILENN